MPDLKPYIIHSSKPIPQHRAHALLSVYLSGAKYTPFLQPNSVLTEEGPKARAGGTAQSLVLHNLERVSAGLRGEYVGRDLSLLKVRMREKPTWKGDGGKSPAKKERGKPAGEAKNEQVENTEWQDFEEYDLEQEELEGEVDPENEDGEQDVGVMETSKPRKRKKDEADGEQDVEVMEASPSQKTKKDKAERKKRKKERTKKESGDVKAERKKRKEEARQKDLVEKGGKGSKKK